MVKSTRNLLLRLGYVGCVLSLGAVHNVKVHQITLSQSLEAIA